MKYFKTQELVSKETYDLYGEDSIKLFTPEILTALDDLREFFNQKVTVNDWLQGGQFQWRGYRTPQKAAELGSPNSEHAKGNAFDCDIEGYTAEQARQKIIGNQNDKLLKNIMRMEADKSWLHIDCKQGPNRIYLFHV
jgi:hypothetical protein